MSNGFLGFQMKSSVDNLELLSLSDTGKWSEYLSRLPIDQQDIYFTPEYYSLYEELGDGKAQCFVFQQGNTLAMYPFLLNSINDVGYSLDKEYFDIQGAYGYNGVVSSTYNPEFTDAFYKAFVEWCNHNNVIAEFIRFHPLLDNHVFSMGHLNILFDRETVVLDLSQSYDKIWSNEYSSQNRNMIRKAHRLGYTVEALSNPPKEKIDRFISLYEYSMKLAGADKYYYFSKGLFYNTFDFFSKNASLLSVLDDAGIVKCSAIFFHYKDYFHYHLSGREFDVDNSVNNFLLNEAVNLASKIGVKIMHFGGGRSNSKDDSLLRFKSNFSKKRLSFHIGKKIHNQKVYDEVVKQWEERNPEKKENYKHHLLKYRC